MDFKHQILFLFSALGALNGLLLSFYFTFKKNNLFNYFLSALLFVLSIRILKSAFFYFNLNLSELYIQIGLSACFLIGPFLYFYIKKTSKKYKKANSNWLYQIIIFLAIIITIGINYPYRENTLLWSNYFVKIIYFQWLIYIILSGFLLKEELTKLLSKTIKLGDIEVWRLSVFLGVSFIWIAYSIGSYTSYLVGTLSFSFVFYLFLLLWFFNSNKSSVFFKNQIKYSNKKIDHVDAKLINVNLTKLMNEKKLYANPNLKLSDVSFELNILPHTLSQFLNDNLNKSFPFFVNEYRVKKAEEILLSNNKLTIEAIGNECGFKSNSTFYSAFKKMKGVTPAKFKKTNYLNGHISPNL
ncbi:helix-turn-helix domain-containing protein [Aquimarina macrocephali]|uniref:helix-turn-helix domain-containing protein n=1 Tax=Aquimarina macrocephali TaxID=666563 RepID=UPI000465AD3B|nr:helix-turn-helix domain-containing protein [Aquimarina macrocephali]